MMSWGKVLTKLQKVDIQIADKADCIPQTYRLQKELTVFPTTLSKGLLDIYFQT